jgi:tRNA pseudouridine55 synthase
VAPPRTELHGVLVLDKTIGPTSHDAVAVGRRALGTREVGHTGTLDPMATGVLVLVVGEGTKLVNLLGAESKAYRATVKLGTATHTLDAEGEVTETRPVPPLTLEQIRQVATAFVGELQQQPPMVSAIKVDGKSMHKRARAGEVVELAKRSVRVDELVIESFDGENIELRVECGKGFYVRSLARDLAEALGSVGHLTALRRTRNGPLSVEGAIDFDGLRAASRGSDEERAQVRERIVPLATVCRGLPHVLLNDAGVLSARHGRAVTLDQLVTPLPAQLPGGTDEGHLIALDEAGVPIAIMQRSVDLLRVARGFRL